MSQASGSEIASFTLSDAPQRPEIYTLKLRGYARQKRLYDNFMDRCKELSPENLLSALNSEKARIMERMKERGHLTEEECELLNKANKKKLKETVEKFIDDACRQMEVTPDDSPEEVEFKLSIGEKLIKWLEDLFNWMIEKLGVIFQRVKEALQWCYQKAKELFEKLCSFFS